VGRWRTQLIARQLVNCRTHEHRHFERTLRSSDTIPGPRLAEGRSIKQDQTACRSWKRTAKRLPERSSRATTVHNFVVCLTRSASLEIKFFPWISFLSFFLSCRTLVIDWLIDWIDSCSFAAIDERRNRGRFFFRKLKNAVSRNARRVPELSRACRAGRTDEAVYRLAQRRFHKSDLYDASQVMRRTEHWKKNWGKILSKALTTTIYFFYNFILLLLFI
jgi:hypothetical protein